MAAVRSKKSFSIGIALAASFFIILTVMLSPVVDGKNVMQFSDEMFSSLAKSSTYFIPELEKKAEKFAGRSLDIKIKMKSGGDAEKAAKLYAGVADFEVKGNELKISGDLGAILKRALSDADAVFKGEKKELYGMGAKEALYYWWITLTKISKECLLAGKSEEGLFVEDVIKKAIEPAYNFYGIEPKTIARYYKTVVGLLAFYVIYTLWWGYAIYFISEGLGIRMEKAKEKKEY